MQHCRGARVAGAAEVLALERAAADAIDAKDLAAAAQSPALLGGAPSSDLKARVRRGATASSCVGTPPVRTCVPRPC